MLKSKPTLADIAVARHLREAARTTPQQDGQRQFRRYAAVILMAMVTTGALLAWAFLG